MHGNKCARLEVHGWHSGDAAGLLALASENAALVETRMSFGWARPPAREGGLPTRFCCAAAFTQPSAAVNGALPPPRWP